MPSFRVELGANSHSVHVGSSMLEKIGELSRKAGLAAGPCAIITDENVARLYLEPAREALLQAGFKPLVIEIAAGEASKSLPTLHQIYDRLIEGGLNRRSSIFALGGGVVGDLAGFAAATFLRGVPLVQVPTTVVGQVDSALGGKTGVNYREVKNLLGAFYQPRLVIADVSLLASLPEREFREGLAEVIKYGAIMDEPMLSKIEDQMPSILGRNESVLEALVDRSLRHKASVVERDEREGNLRAILNFGHTVGHALEAATNFSHFLHGEAVAIGMVAAAGISARFAGLSAQEERRLHKLITKAGLPTELPAVVKTEEFTRALGLDKKRAGNGVEFILLSRLGAAVTSKLGFEEIMAQLG
jgi:3-dehydroquinate synthase